MKQAIIRAHDLSKRFAQGAITTQVLSNVTFSFMQGGSYAIIGASGSGKSTLLHLLAGIEMPTAGHVLFNNRSISCFSEREKQQFLNEVVGLVFQRPYLIDELTVLENVMLKQMITSCDVQKSRKRAYNLLAEMELSGKADACPATLSGGQQQRVALARALLNRPLFIIADEPTGNLDHETGRKIIDLLLRYCSEWQMGLIVSSHDASVTVRMSVQLRVHGGQLERKM